MRKLDNALNGVRRVGTPVTPGRNVQICETSTPLDICVLSLEEAGRLEHYGIWPACKAHRHMKKTAALEAIKAETHRFVGGPDTKIEFASCIVEVNTTRIWSPVACHDIDGKTIQGMRTWGLQPLG